MPPLVDDEGLFLEQHDELAAVQSDIVDPFGHIVSDEGFDHLQSDDVLAAQALEEQLADDEAEHQFQSAPVANMDEDEDEEDDEDADTIEPIPKKRGSSSATLKGRATKTSRTSKSTTAPATSGRTRKNAVEDAEEQDDTPPVKAGPSRKRKSSGGGESSAKRSRPSRPAAKSARAAMKEANKPKQGQVKATRTAATKTGTRGRSGGRKNAANDHVPDDEYEVEKILDSQIDGDTLQHMYRVKWKGYPENQSTWEPKANLAHSAEMMRQFDAEKKKAAKEAASKEKKAGGLKKVEKAGTAGGKAVKAVKAKTKSVKPSTKKSVSAPKKRALRRTSRA